MSDASQWFGEPGHGETVDDRDEAHGAPGAAGGEDDPFDRLAEEFAERCRRGEDPSIAEYETRYPEHSEKVRRLLPTVAMMEQLKRGTQQARERVSVRPLPERLGEFRVLRELGRGGMGVVYEAVQESLGRHVALKVVHHVHLDTRRLQRFQREAQAIAHLHHTNIVPIFGVGEHEGLPYYAMQYIRGRGLDAVLNEWRVGGPPRADDRGRFAARVGRQVAEALEYAHEQGVLHRDIKPANLLIDEHEAVWVADFGLAKIAGHADLTASGDVIGTLRYLAPEALRGETGPRGDVYSLGLTLYEVLTLNPPFGDVTPSELLHRVSEGRPVRPRKHDPAIPRDLETIILKASAREPAVRYATAGALAEDLRCFLEDRPIRARRATAAERLWRWGRRNPGTAGLIATAAVSLLTAAVVGWASYGITEQALQRSRANERLSLDVFEDLFDKLAPSDSLSRIPLGRLSRLRPSRGGPPGDRPPGPGRGPFGGSPPPRTGGHGGEGSRPPPPPPEGRGGPPGPERGPLGGPPGDDRPAASVQNTLLLQSVLSFYERFARQNATNPKLQEEAARAYRKVGALSLSLGRDKEAEQANARAIAMLEDLALHFPRVLGYRFELIEAALGVDPWRVEHASLSRIEPRLRRARGLAHRLASEEPGNSEYSQAQIQAEVKLAVVLQRLGRVAEAEAGYRSAIDLAGALIGRSQGPDRARLDRVAAREALALLLLDLDRREEALAALDAMVADLRPVSTREGLAQPVADHVQNLAQIYQSLGETERAEEMALWSQTLRSRRSRPSPGPRGRDTAPPRSGEAPP